MSDTSLPQEVMMWINQLGWPMHHLEWHTERQWDRLSDVDRRWAEQRGWRRASQQEGAAGNGYDFLMMHRAMLAMLREKFPQHANLFKGWTTPPTNPHDPQDSLPNGANTPFDPDKAKAIKRLTDQIATFASEDELGLFIETRSRPTASDPFGQSPDAESGIHNYLHNRFSDRTSPVDMGQPSKNLGNERFWRLHGWIDDCWTRYRQAKGLPDTEANYAARLNEERHHLSGHMEHAIHALAAAAAPLVPAPSEIPEAIRNPFRETISARFHRLMETNPEPSTVAELCSYLQLAIKLEHFTLPLYLTAYWSLKPSAATGGQMEIILRIAMQEMSHMALCCNLVAALGDIPRILEPEMLPHYPAELPGMQSPKTFQLEAFSKAQIERFLEIELPEGGPIPPQLAISALELPTAKFKTIGDFYDAIDRGLVKLDQAQKLPAFTLTGQRAFQVDQPEDVFIIRTVEDARRAIKFIKEQGEGTTSSQGATTFGGTLAHYYAFDQIVREMMYEKQADGTFKLDPAQPLKLPTAEQVLPMAPVPASGYPDFPKAVEFDEAYSAMLAKLQEAWETDSDDALLEAVIAMPNLTLLARGLMKTPITAGGSATYGPSFIYRPPAAPAADPAGLAALVEPLAPTAPLTKSPGYSRIQQILDQAVNNQEIGGHGAFWRTLTRDQFVTKAVFGKRLIAVKADGSFDPQESNLVKALEGRAPFGANLSPPPAGAIFNQMPDGFPPVPAEQIAEIRDWIGAGCPELAISNLPFIRGIQAGDETLAFDHNAFWRDFDNWAMFQVTPEISDDINTFFAAADTWLAFAKQNAPESAWTTALADGSLRQAVIRLGTRQLQTVARHYGRPTALSVLLDSFEQFGNDTLPNDEARPADVRHRMNGAGMWFYWSAFCDASLRLAPQNAVIPAPDWQQLGRAILLGLLNDGVFRRRYRVNGFAADDAGKEAMRAHVSNLPAEQLGHELARRYFES